MAVRSTPTTPTTFTTVPGSQTTLCSTCCKPIALEVAKTDESGQAIHEDCYLLELNRKQAS